MASTLVAMASNHLMDPRSKDHVEQVAGQELTEQWGEWDVAHEAIPISLPGFSELEFHARIWSRQGETGLCIKRSGEEEPPFEELRWSDRQLGFRFQNEVSNS